MEDVEAYELPWPDEWDVERGVKYTPRAIGRVIGARVLVHRARALRAENTGRRHSLASKVGEESMERILGLQSYA